MQPFRDEGGQCDALLASQAPGLFEDRRGDVNRDPHSATISNDRIDADPLVRAWSRLRPFAAYNPPHRFPDSTVFMDYDLTTIPATYDRGHDHGSAVLDQWMDEIASHVEASAIHDILDLACGTGRFAPSLAERFDATVIGLDPSMKMLRVAEEKCARVEARRLRVPAHHHERSDRELSVSAILPGQPSAARAAIAVVGQELRGV